ncbi:MAG: 2-C-methyl-D-erythritol 4-phosphate cytidylyltransferase [Patescibacteria group bacterium]|nr:2-C-methyl-D-erythritol 4-phosphate cytidylyltransferase [Patescibacteria group bacterium]
MNIAIILASGSSKRMKGIDKLFFKIKKKPLIFYTLLAFEKHPQIKKIVLVAKKSNFEKLANLIKKYKLSKVVQITEGGKERQDSAFNGLQTVGKLGAKAKDIILFHNGANPLVSKQEISNCLSAVKKYGAALVGQLARDTVKTINRKGEVLKTLDRRKIFLAQTPQAIEYELAQTVFSKAFKENFKGTDDVSLVERFGKKVKIVPCSYKNIKVTTKDDLQIIKTFL